MKDLDFIPAGGEDISGLATRELDNLRDVAINTSLIPDTDSFYDVGSLSLRFSSGWFATKVVSPVWQFAPSVGVKMTTSTAIGRDSLEIEATSGIDTDIRLILPPKGNGEVDFLHGASVGNLGSVGTPWTNLFIDTIQGDTTFGGSITRDGDNTFELISNKADGAGNIGFKKIHISYTTQETPR